MDEVKKSDNDIFKPDIPLEKPAVICVSVENDGHVHDENKWKAYLFHSSCYFSRTAGVSEF